MTTRKTFKKRVRGRQEKEGESYSAARQRVTDAASSTAEVRKGFRRMAEEMRRGRAAWMPGPPMDLDRWLALPLVPLEEGVEMPTRSLLVAEVGALQAPLAELLRRGVLRRNDLVDPTADPNEGCGFLGTATIENGGGEPTLYRLPPPLGTWAAGHIGHARQCQDDFPAYFGFCSPRPGYFGVVPLPPPEEELRRQEQAYREWQALPELAIPAVADPSNTEGRYEILDGEVVCLHSAALEMNGDGLPDAVAGAGVKVRRSAGRPAVDGLVSVGTWRVALPVALVWTLAGPITYRLPPPLANWVIEMAAQSMLQGASTFPAEVEFCRIDGGYTAELRVR